MLSRNNNVICEKLDILKQIINILPNKKTPFFLGLRAKYQSLDELFSDLSNDNNIDINDTNLHIPAILGRYVTQAIDMFAEEINPNLTSEKQRLALTEDEKTVCKKCIGILSDLNGVINKQTISDKIKANSFVIKKPKVEWFVSKNHEESSYDAYKRSFFKRINNNILKKSSYTNNTEEKKSFKEQVKAFILVPEMKKARPFTQDIKNILEDSKLEFTKKAAKIEKLYLEYKPGIFTLEETKDFYNNIRTNAHIISAFDAFHKGEIDTHRLVNILQNIEPLNKQVQALKTAVANMETEYAIHYNNFYQQLEHEMKSTATPGLIKVLEDQLAARNKNANKLNEKIQKLNFWNIWEKRKLGSEKEKETKEISVLKKNLENLKNSKPPKGKQVANDILKPDDTTLTTWCNVIFGRYIKDLNIELDRAPDVSAPV